MPFRRIGVAIHLTGGDKPRPPALRLNAILIIAACERLHRRIEARFPGSGLSRVGGDLVKTAEATEARTRALARPYYLTRSFSAVPVALVTGLIGYGASRIDWNTAFAGADVTNMLEGLDALVSLLVLIAGAIWFVLSMEARRKRRHVLDGLFELRSIAHVIDMHQLTKYPSAERRLARTKVSIDQALSDPQLARYLDYCTEMLALIAKLAAVHAAESQGPEVTAAIGDVEDLTSDLGRRIWQKIQLINATPL